MALAASESSCESLRRDCDELWRSLPSHPFLVELAAGTLPLERFRFFLEQDVEFLLGTLQALGIALGRFEDEGEAALLIGEASLIVERELENERSLLARVEEQTGPPPDVVRAPATVAYIGWLCATAVRGDPIDTLVALHPCIWSYADIAVEIEKSLVDHPIYTEWVRFFAAEDYTSAVRERTEALSALLKGLPERKLQHLSALFTQGTRLEMWFWDMAHRAEHWPDLREVT